MRYNNALLRNGYLGHLLYKCSIFLQLVLLSGWLSSISSTCHVIVEAAVPLEDALVVAVAVAVLGAAELSTPAPAGGPGAVQVQALVQQPTAIHAAAWRKEQG